MYKRKHPTRIAFTSRSGQHGSHCRWKQLAHSFLLQHRVKPLNVAAFHLEIVGGTRCRFPMKLAQKILNTTTSVSESSG